MAMYRIYDISGDIPKSGITTIDINNDTIIDKIIKR
jgi:hypothetical protein